MEFSDSLMRDARAMRRWYLRGLMIDGWNAALGVFRKLGRYLRQETSLRLPEM